MKKILTIALVALFAASSVFAGLSGYSNLGFGYNSSSKKLGFNPDSALSVDLDVATADGSKVGEGDVYAGIDASLKLRLLDAKSNGVNTYVYSEGNDLGVYGFGVFAFINDVYIAGQDWKVSFGTASSNPVDFAKSPVDTYKTALKDAFNQVYDLKNSAVSYAVPYASNAGFVATYKDYKVGVGFAGAPLDYKTGDVVNDDLAEDNKILLGYTAYFVTPEIALGDVTVKFGAVASKAPYSSKKGPGVTTTSTKTFDITGTVGSTAITDGKGTQTVKTTTENKEYSKAYTSAGGSLAVGYAKDAFSVKVAADLGVKNITKDNKFGYDVLANVKYDFVALDVYFGDGFTYTPKKLDSEDASKIVDGDEVTVDKLLSTQVVADLATAEVAPLKLTLKGKNLINKQDLSLSAEVTVSEAFSFTVGGGYVIKDEKLTANLGVKYVHEMFTASASGKFTLKKDKSKYLVPEVVVSSEALVNGATLELSWKGITDDWGNDTTNLLDLKNSDWGKIYATAKVSF